MNPLKKDKIRDMTPPKSIKDLHRIMGLFSYYRWYIINFAQIALPLYKLLQKNEPWVWLEPQINAFSILKDHLIQYPILSPPDFHKNFSYSLMLQIMLWDLFSLKWIMMLNTS
jgi:hypothetical protein